MLSQDFIEAMSIEPESIGARALPALELPRRLKIPVYGILLETGLDFT